MAVYLVPVTPARVRLIKDDASAPGGKVAIIATIPQGWAINVDDHYYEGPEGSAATRHTIGLAYATEDEANERVKAILFARKPPEPSHIDAIWKTI